MAITPKIRPRKIISIGYSRLVSLPKFWVQHHDLGSKDRIQLIINDDESITVHPIKGSKHD